MIKLFPIVNEKTVILAKSNQFTFEVSGNLTKKTIELEIKRIFKITPISVNIINKKAIAGKKMNRISIKKAQKRAIIKTKIKEIIPGFESFLTEEKDKKGKAGKKTKND